jgi:hypothetical protein
MIIKKCALYISILMMIACSSGSDKKNGRDGGLDGAMSGFNINTMITKTVLDSVPFATLPYTDSICIANDLPLRKIRISVADIGLLKIKKLREFSDQSDEMPDSLFTLVCRLDLSPEYYSLIINCNNESETMNYLINYDRDFRVIDYMETCFEQIADCLTRTTSVIDTSGVTVSHSNILDPSGSKAYIYVISPDGFFREMPDQQADAVN